MFQKVLVESMATEAGIRASGAVAAARPAIGPIRQFGDGDPLPESS